MAEPSSGFGISDVRIAIVHRRADALRAAAAPTQAVARYHRGRADGLGEALQLVDAFLRSEEAGAAVVVQPVEEIVAVVASIAEGT